MPRSLGDSSVLIDDDDVDMQWSLVGRVDGRKMKIIRMQSFPFRVGRRSDLELTLQSYEVSKLHAEIFAESKTLYVRDLESTNGTLVNGIPVKEPVAVKQGDVIQFADFEFVLQNASPMASEKHTVCSSRMGSFFELRRILVDRMIVPHFQPIVCLSSARIVGYEVLARTMVEGLRTAHDMFSAAERAGLERELSALSREMGVFQGRSFTANLPLFLNTHPSEVTDPSLISSLVDLREKNPDTRIILEIHEAAVCDAGNMRNLNRVLRDFKIGLAYDDFGQGQSRLVELMDVPPLVLKFDMQLIRGIDTATAARRHALESLVQMALKVGSHPLAEGVETVGEAKACFDMGFKMMQGYLSGRSAPAAESLASQVQTKFGKESGASSRQANDHWLAEIKGSARTKAVPMAKQRTAQHVPK